MLTVINFEDSHCKDLDLDLDLFRLHESLYMM
jgi:hypothetical protein